MSKPNTKINTQYSILNTKQVFAVILVGGKGKRLRPLSTDVIPKAFLSVTKDRRTMFESTVDRIKKIIPEKNIIVSANKRHMNLVKKDFPKISKANLILEPVSRNTAPATGLAALLLKKRFRNAIMVVIPADQYIIDEKKYLEAVKRGVEFASGEDSLIVLALKPTYPATAFGYIKLKTQNSRLPGGQAILNTKKIYKVKKFVEKPDLATAKRYIRDGRFFWNSGMFIFSANSVLKAFSEFAPDIFSLLAQTDEKNINKLYEKFPDISIDYAIMEKADNIYCVKGSYRWRDIGSFGSLKEVLNRESRKFIEKKGRIIRIF